MCKGYQLFGLSYQLRLTKAMIPEKTIHELIGLFMRLHCVRFRGIPVDDFGDFGRIELARFKELHHNGLELVTAPDA
jgi:hypothetical protein